MSELAARHIEHIPGRCETSQQAQQVARGFLLGIFLGRPDTLARQSAESHNDSEGPGGIGGRRAHKVLGERKGPGLGKSHQPILVVCVSQHVLD